MPAALEAAIDPRASAYLDRLRRAARDLPARRRRVVIGELEAHRRVGIPRRASDAVITFAALALPGVAPIVAAVYLARRARPAAGVG